MIPRLALAREPEDALSLAIASVGWEPVSWNPTVVAATQAPRPIGSFAAALVLSPSGARAAARDLCGWDCLVPGAATAAALPESHVTLSAGPRAEDLWALLQQRYPQGGAFLLVRGTRSRGHLESVSEGTPWRLTPWITHAERPADPLPPLPAVEAVLPLSPLQAEVMAPCIGGVTRFAWGSRTAEALSRCGVPAHGVCEPRIESLKTLLSTP